MPEKQNKTKRKEETPEKLKNPLKYKKIKRTKKRAYELRT